MLGDIIADLVLEVVFRPVLKALDTVGGHMKRGLSQFRTRVQSDSGGQQASEERVSTEIDAHEKQNR